MTIDFAAYIRAPRISAASGVVLSIRLLRAAPKDLTSAELAALTTLRNAAKAVQESMRQRHRSSGSTIPALEAEFDGSWGGLHGRIFPWTRLVHRPERPRSSELLAKLFPNGLTFLAWKNDAKWLHSRMLLDRIATEQLTADVVELAGEPFLSSVESAHKDLGDALGLDETATPDPSPGPGLGERVTALAEAMSRYGRSLSGVVDLADPTSRDRFMIAVAPFDEYRAHQRRTMVAGAANDGEPIGETESETGDALDVDSPLPPIDPTP